MLKRLKVNKNRSHGRRGGCCDDDVARLQAVVFIDQTSMMMIMTNDIPM